MLFQIFIHAQIDGGGGGGQGSGSQNPPSGKLQTF